MRLLLDTCSFLWIIGNADRLSVAARDAFVDPAHEVYLSAVSAWEITVKKGLARLDVPEPVGVFVTSQRKAHGIEALPLHEEAVFHLALLPPLHRDPFDRMLVCQAIAGGLTLVTPDPLIRQYPVRTLW